MFAGQLGTVPLQQIVRGATYAGGGSKRVKTMLAALLLVKEGPAKADQREDDKEDDLKQLRGIRQRRMDRLADIRAQQKSEKQNERHLRTEKKLSLHPMKFFAASASLNMPV
jgi:hypothetical protein